MIGLVVIGVLIGSAGMGERRLEKMRYGNGLKGVICS